MTDQAAKRVMYSKWNAAYRAKTKDSNKCVDCTLPRVNDTCRCKGCGERNRQRNRKDGWHPVDRALGTDE
jgi:hypothetical protein